MNKNQQQSPKKVAVGCGIMAVLAVILFFSVKSCFSSEEDPLKKEKDLKIKAITLSQYCVKEKLKSPASADFPVDLNHVKIITDSLFVINSYVDAQNSFGATIRTNYRCTVSTTNNGNSYICVEVILFDK